MSRKLSQSMVITIHHDRALLSEIRAEEQFLLMLP
jgi:hypothetical protein